MAKKSGFLASAIEDFRRSPKARKLRADFLRNVKGLSEAEIARETGISLTRGDALREIDRLRDEVREQKNQRAKEKTEMSAMLAKVQQELTDLKAERARLRIENEQLRAELERAATPSVRRAISLTGDLA